MTMSGVSRARRTVAVALAVVLALAGAAVAVSSPAEGKNSRVNVGGGRSYVLHSPPVRVDPPAVPDTALIVLHGLANNWMQAAQKTGFSTLSDQRNFLVAYPIGWRKSWNAGVCCGDASRYGVDDIGYLSRVVYDLRKRGVSRVAVVGFSNGGMMAYAFGCARPDLVRRVGVVAGSLQVRRCAAPIEVLHIHGLADQIVPYKGTGWQPRLKCWVRDVRTIPRVVSRGKVTIVPVEGLTHRWPKLPDGVDASEELWRFASV